MTRAASLYPSIETDRSYFERSSHIIQYIYNMLLCLHTYLIITTIDQEVRLAEPQGMTNNPYVVLSGVGMKRQRERNVQTTGGGSSEVTTQPDTSKARATPLWVQKVGCGWYTSAPLLLIVVCTCCRL